MLTPKQIVQELDRHIVGQEAAKKAVAIALRNRWRRQQVDPSLRQEIVPKNILMIGPTGVGKTEIARRLARLADAPFLKIEATKFTEVGYVGRDVDSIIRDLVDVSINIIRERKRTETKERVEKAVEDRLLDALVGKSSSEETRRKFRERLVAGELEDKEVEIEIEEQVNPFSSMELPGGAGHIGMMSISDMFGKGMSRTSTKKMQVSAAREMLKGEEAEKLIDHEKLTQEAIHSVEQDGIVFIDEIDKVAARSDVKGGEVSREGVQRDLLPLIEGTTVNTKHGFVKTDHILFIASGAFHMAKPSDLLPELQGRLPIRVELNPLGEAEMFRILTEPEASLTKQYIALLATEGVTLDFTDEGVRALAALAARCNREIENIGARRLHTLLERLLETISFEAPDCQGQSFVIDAAYVESHVGELARDIDVSRFIL